MNVVRQLVQYLYIPSSLRFPIYSPQVDLASLLQTNHIFKTRIEGSKVIFKDGNFGILENKIHTIVNGGELESKIDFTNPSFITFENVPTAVFKLFFDSAHLLSTENDEMVKNINESEFYSMINFFDKNGSELLSFINDKSELSVQLQKLIRKYQHGHVAFRVLDKNWNGPTDSYNYQDPSTDGERFKLLRNLDIECKRSWTMSFLPTMSSCYAELGFDLSDSHRDFLTGISSFFGPTYQGERLATGTNVYGRVVQESKNNSLVYPLIYLQEAMKRVGIAVTDLR